MPEIPVVLFFSHNFDELLQGFECAAPEVGNVRFE